MRVWVVEERGRGRVWGGVRGTSILAGSHAERLVHHEGLAAGSSSGSREDTLAEGGLAPLPRRRRTGCGSHVFRIRQAWTFAWDLQAIARSALCTLPSVVGGDREPAR